MSKEVRSAIYIYWENQTIHSKLTLALPDLDKPFEIRTNAFNYAIGGVLF